MQIVDLGRNQSATERQSASFQFLYVEADHLPAFTYRNSKRRKENKEGRN